MLRDLMPEKKVGISNIYVRNPHIKISSEELAKAISAKDFIAEIEAIASARSLLQ